MEALIWLGLVLIGTTVWVGYDAHKNKISTNAKEPYSSTKMAVTWAVACLFLWVVMFPYYLIRRSRTLSSSIPAESPSQSELKEPLVPLEPLPVTSAFTPLPRRKRLGSFIAAFFVLICLLALLFVIISSPRYHWYGSYSSVGGKECCFTLSRNTFEIAVLLKEGKYSTTVILTGYNVKQVSSNEITIVGEDSKSATKETVAYTITKTKEGFSLERKSGFYPAPLGLFQKDN